MCIVFHRFMYIGCHYGQNILDLRKTASTNQSLKVFIIFFLTCVPNRTNLYEMGSASELTVAARGMTHIYTIYNNYLHSNIISLTPFTTTITKSCLQSDKTHFTQTQSTRFAKTPHQNPKHI